MVPWATRVSPPNGISIDSAVFAVLTNVNNRQTDRQTDHAIHRLQQAAIAVMRPMISQKNTKIHKKNRHQHKQTSHCEKDAKILPAPPPSPFYVHLPRKSVSHSSSVFFLNLFCRKSLAINVQRLHGPAARPPSRHLPTISNH